MLPFLFVLTCAALIVSFGVSVSYYLHSHDARRQRNCRRVARVGEFVTQPAYDDDGFRVSTGVLTDATSRYARNFLFVLASALVFAALFVTILLH